MQSFWSIREFTKYILRYFALPIRGGPLKGKKWIVASGSKFLLGTYEPKQTLAIQDMLHDGDVFYDVGAHVGYYTVLASVLVGPWGQVIAFEPRPLNVSYLKRHLALNHCINVKVIEACVADGSGSCRFEARCGSGTGHVSPTGNLTVRLVSLDELFSAGEIPPPSFIKIDVEGSELLVLKGAQILISDFLPMILVATHSEELHRQCLEFLISVGYKCQSISQSKGDKEILAVPKV